MRDILSAGPPQLYLLPIVKVWSLCMQDIANTTAIRSTCSLPFASHAPHVPLCRVNTTECIVLLPSRGVMEHNTSDWSRVY